MYLCSILLKIKQQLKNNIMETSIVKTPSHLSFTIENDKFDLSFNFINKKCPRFGYFGLVNRPDYNQKSLFFGFFSIRLAKY